MKAESLTQSSYKSKPHSTPGHHRLNALDNEGREDEFPRISNYCFSVGVSGLIFARHNLGETSKWTRNNEKSSEWKDKSKWCTYKEDFAHVSEYYIALRKGN